MSGDAQVNEDDLALAERICGWILNLCNKEDRPVAMLELCDRRRQIPNLGPMLWESFGAVAGLLQEVVDVYPAVAVNSLDEKQSQRIFAALSLFMSMAKHTRTGVVLMRTELLHYLMPLLGLKQKTSPIEHVRLSVLVIICGLLKRNTTEIICYTLAAELIPQLLRLLEQGSCMSKVLCSFILYRILDNEVGLTFATRRLARRTHLIHTLGRVIHQQTLEPDPRILKHVLHIYTRLADDPRSLVMLQLHLPMQLRNGFFAMEEIATYNTVKTDLRVLNEKVAIKPFASTAAGDSFCSIS